MGIETSKYTKAELLDLFRTLGSKIYEEIKGKKTPITKMNTQLKKITETLVKPVVENTDLSNEERLDKILMIYYCSYIIMIEFRNRMRPYEYMDFTRRVGELWEPFCKLCWKYTSEEGIADVIPPTFIEAKLQLLTDLNSFIETTSLTEEQKQELNRYLELMWELVASGEIKLESDLHFEKDGVKYNVDFKSGFNSNEKGNTNRLLMVGSIYKKLDPNYENIILVRAEESENNHYLQTLKNSSQWKVFCGQETYDKIEELTGFPLKRWINQNIDWENDLDSETINYLRENNLNQYLRW
ncbi:MULTISPECIES: hypothetical protein [Bacillus subtilis group]|uniref:hypothetical protein n=1 Tax=Bacillus subtilis group TaxID=653685 RepID=UPI000BA2294F|nr:MULTISPECIES: hypothetical protein [Bacillus subtilis group]ASU98579.1 hypothetical protein CJZ70_09630 [Bacillus subtilis]MDN4142201.1 hypothetical protein [Bacillus velezensis]UVW11676.1 hypothetical protein NX823_10940 [Bacillus subtilis]